jgi:hypothetical protein
MPRGDGTGPEGQGPMTGRGAGYCAGSSEPVFINNAMGRGARGWGGRGGQGRGRGRGHRYRYLETGLTGGQRAALGGPFGWPAAAAPVATREQELERLEQQAELYEQAVEELRKRIDEVKSSPEKIEEK